MCMMKLKVGDLSAFGVYAKSNRSDGVVWLCTEGDGGNPVSTYYLIAATIADAGYLIEYVYMIGSGPDDRELMAQVTPNANAAAEQAKAEARDKLDALMHAEYDRVAQALQAYGLSVLLGKWDKC